VVNRRAWLTGEYSWMKLSGKEAIALGIATIALAGFVHSHYFWGNVDRFGNVPMVVGKVVSLIAMIGGLGYVIVRAFT
jgi:hypothetical protein